MKVYIASDHAGEEKCNLLVEYLNENNININKIPLENNETDDYPDFAFYLGNEVIKEKALGILLCGNGIGMSIAANKVKGIRAARCLSKDDAFRAKNHNSANVLCLDSSQEIEKLKEITDVFLVTKEPTEERHIRRVDKIKRFEDEL